MRVVRVRNGRTGALLGHEVRLADSWWSRAVGLLGVRQLPRGSGLLLVPCASVHTVGMRFPLDLVFLDRAGTIRGTRTNLTPGRFAVGGNDVQATLELPAGTLAETDTREGDPLILQEAKP